MPGYKGSRVGKVNFLGVTCELETGRPGVSAASSTGDKYGEGG